MRCAKQRNTKVNWRYREANNNNNGAQTVNILCGYYKPLSLPLKVFFVFLYLDFVFISSFYDFPSFCHPNILLIVCVLLRLSSFFCCVAVCDYLDRMFLLHIGMFLRLNWPVSFLRLDCVCELCVFDVCVAGILCIVSMWRGYGHLVINWSVKKIFLVSCVPCINMSKLLSATSRVNAERYRYIVPTTTTTTTKSIRMMKESFPFVNPKNRFGMCVCGISHCRHYLTQSNFKYVCELWHMSTAVICTKSSEPFVVSSTVLRYAGLMSDCFYPKKVFVVYFIRFASLNGYRQREHFSFRFVVVAIKQTKNK